MIDMNKLYLCVLALFFIVQIHAQDIEVKKFELLEKDQTAVTSPRKDINGTACGLVKVALKEAGAEFEGSVMGDVQFTGKEYLVYLPNGTKRLGIKHPDYLPTTIVFADYGTKKVASSTTYELKVKTNKKKAKVDNSKKGMAVFNIDSRWLRRSLYIVITIWYTLLYCEVKGLQYQQPISADR